ncbi:MAG: ATP-binding protein [Bacteroidales bacterium]|jgi:PAS domain S-box-containing protein
MDKQKALKFLFIEDVPADMELALHHLRMSGLLIVSERVEDKESLIKALDEFKPDLVISDYSMPTFDGMQALGICLEKNPNLPFIILTGSIDEQTAVSCLKAGAADYVIKEHIIRLPFAVNDALLLANSRKAQKDSELAFILNDQLLLRERSLLRTVIDNLPDRIFFKDIHSRFVIANEGVAKHIGIASSDGLIGKSDFDFYPPEHAEEYFRLEQELLNSDCPLINHEEPSRDAAGNFGWTLTSKIPVKDANGSILGLVGISRDITALKKSNEELMKAKNMAEQSNQLKDAFIANISHEIRTPLNSILGFSDLIKESFAAYSTAETDNFFDIIDQSSRRLMRTVDMILSMSRLQIGEISVNPQPLDIESLISKLVGQYSLAAKKKSLDLIFRSSCHGGTIISDDYCVTHAVSNLIDNAIKYTKHGQVHVTLSMTPKKEFMLEVADTGIGISDEYKGHLFNPFSQEEPGISRPYEGIGLGLSLTKKLLDNIGATIQVESRQGIGSKFFILFRNMHARPRV